VLVNFFNVLSTFKGLVVAPKGVRHFVWAKDETVIQVSGMGPFEINYVNPAEDPRKASKK
jgi:hypothetical protein